LCVPIKNALEISGNHVDINRTTKAHSRGADLHPGGSRLGLDHLCNLFLAFLNAQELIPAGAVDTAPTTQLDSDVIFRNVLAHSVRIDMEHFRKRYRVRAVSVNQVLKIIALFLFF
jgi:hypothetical protein